MTLEVAGTVRMTKEKRAEVDSYAARHGITTYSAAVNVLVAKGLQAERIAALDAALTNRSRRHPRGQA